METNKLKRADVIGWIGSAFFGLGTILLAYKSMWGFILNLIGNLCYVKQGHMVGLKSLTILSMVLSILDLFGLYKWIH